MAAHNILTCAPWTNLAAGSALALVMERCPSSHPWGYQTDLAYPYSSSRQRPQWFGSRNELLLFLLRVEPQIWGLTHGANINEYHLRALPIIAKAQMFGLNDVLLEEFNESMSPWFRITWWGIRQHKYVFRDTKPTQINRTFTPHSNIP